MNRKIFALLSASALAFTFACGDDEDTTTSTTSTTSTSNGGTGGTGTSNGGAGGGTTAECTVDGAARPAAGDCQAACEILFCCAEGDRCAGLDSSSEDAFIDGCLDGCAANMALIAVVNGGDCDGTVNTIKTVNPTFAASCDGTGTGGAGGSGGGAGGN